MATVTHRLAFERPILELEAKIAELEKAGGSDYAQLEEIRNRKRELAELKRKVYSGLTPWETVQVARHPERPMTSDYLNLVFDEFVELHGDKFFGDDRAMRCGFAKLDRYKVMVVGHQKGKTLKERIACYSGCAHPEGYRKALGKMKLAAKYGLPIVCFIDTPGAYPGIGAEERGQAQVIAQNMFEMSRLESPVICVVIGEGGSGGALGIGVGDKVAMLEHAYYSVISPEGCAGILWKSRLRRTSGPGPEDDFQGPEPAESDRRRDRGAAGGRPSRSPPDGRPAEALSDQVPPRADGDSQGSAGRRPVREVPPHGRLSGRRFRRTGAGA